jgi:hypothetical protein
MMLKTFSVVMLALAMSVGLADARVLHRHAIPGCTPGNAAMATCACGKVNGRPMLCHRGQWCHPDRACTA